MAEHDHPDFPDTICRYVEISHDGPGWYMWQDHELGGLIGPCPDSQKIKAKQIDKLTREMNALRGVNAGVVNEYESMGGSLDLTMARIEHLMNFLVEQGVMTNLQHVTEQLAWEKHLRPQVIAARDTKREEVKETQRLVEQARASQEARSKLVLPPSAKRHKK